MNDGAKANKVRTAAMTLKRSLEQAGLAPGAQLTLAEFAEFPSVVLVQFYDILNPTQES